MILTFSSIRAKTLGTAPPLGLSSLCQLSCQPLHTMWPMSPMPHATPRHPTCPDHVILLTTSHEPCSTTRHHTTHLVTPCHTSSHTSQKAHSFSCQLLLLCQDSTPALCPDSDADRSQACLCVAPSTRLSPGSGHILGAQGSVTFSPLSAVAAPGPGKLFANRAAQPSCTSCRKKNRFLAPRRVVMGSSRTDTGLGRQLLLSH